VILPALFHWAPAERHESIRTTGLVPFSPSTIASGELAYICLSPTPSSGWGLSGDMDWASDIEEWDLWQVRLSDGDEVHIRSDFGPVIREVKVHNPIAAERVWWVARRCHPASLRPEAGM
jgi:hypothetical protein